jgi:ATP-dependent DNA helicase RecQ
MEHQSIHDILEHYWGYTQFRPLQEDIINSVLAGNDTLGLLPTGGGKSITFQVPALALSGITIVVTPLISLMKDQVDNLRANNVKAIYLHSGLTRSEHRLAMDKCRLKKIKILYLSPEKLRSENFIGELRTWDVSLVVVDEAHCISQWGYDFRPSYLQISKLRTLFPQVPILALTASATPDVVKDICEQLGMKNAQIFSKSFYRDNLSYIARYSDHKEGMMVKILKATSGSAIVYVRSRRRTRELAEILDKEGISADFYHAGLDSNDKNEKQNRWKNDQTRVMVATNAFGMGIDKPDVRLVIHHDLPSSLEEYYQEAGRGGRDGKPAFALILVAKSDKATFTRRLNESFPPKDFIIDVYNKVGIFLDIAIGEGYNHLYEFNFNLFCKRYNLPITTAHSALHILTQAQYIEFTEEVTTQSRMMILASKNELYNLSIDDSTDRVFQTILRSYTGLFSDYVFINEALIASRLNIPENEVYQALLTLSHYHIIHYIPKKSTPYILYTTSRELPKYIQIPKSVYEERRNRMEARLNAMKNFAFTQEECRQNILLQYFGEKPSEPCGKCDVCRDKKSRAKSEHNESTLRESILYICNQPGGHTIDHVIQNTNFDRKSVIEMIRTLIDEGYITLINNILTTTKH